MPCSVLVVDDDPDNRDVLAEYLTFCGFRVASARSGTEALSLALEIRPRVVLMGNGCVSRFSAVPRLGPAESEQFDAVRRAIAR